MPMPTTSGPKFEVDWYANGTYYDMTSLTLATDDPVTVDYGRDTARSTAPPMIGAGDLTLYNHGREFSPENPGTPWYQFIKPGRPSRISIQHGERRLLRSHTLLRSHLPLRGIGVWPLIDGHLSAFAHDLEMGNERVGASVMDRAARLFRKRISVPYLGDTRTDTAAEAVLNAVGWPYTKRALHVSDSVMNGWWVDDRPAWDVLVELQATEGAGALFWIDGFSVFHWLNRNHRVTETRSNTVQAILHDGTYTGTGGLLYDIDRFRYDPKWDDIVDRVSITTTRRQTDAAPSVIWKLGADLVVGAGQTEAITIRPKDPFVGAIRPVVATDYTVAGGTVSIDPSWDAGANVILYVTGLTGTSTISGLQLRAYSYPVVGETDYEVRADADVIEGEEKTLKLNVWPMLDPAQAKAIAESYAGRYRDSHPIIDVTVRNLDGDAMEKMLYLRVSDRVTIINHHLGLEPGTDCYIERLKHTSLGDGRHALTLSCEPVSAVGTLGGVWGTAIWDVSNWGV